MSPCRLTLTELLQNADPLYSCSHSLLSSFRTIFGAADRFVTVGVAVLVISVTLSEFRDDHASIDEGIEQ